MVSKKINKKYGWPKFLNVLAWILFLILLIYVIIAVTYTSLYYVSQRKLKNFFISNMQTFDQELGQTTYDFDKDENGVKWMIQSLAKSIMMELMAYYNNNVNTVIIVVDNIIHYKPIGFVPPNMHIKLPDSIPNDLSKSITQFILIILQNIPINVLRVTNFFQRFLVAFSYTISEGPPKMLIQQLMKWGDQHLPSNKNI